MGLNINDIENELSQDYIDDQSVAQTGGGGFERKRLPIGRHPIRLVSYVELGVQPGGMYDGKPKPDENQVRLGFEFLGKRTVEEREDGTIYAPRKAMTKKLSYHTKAGFYKLFMLMRGGDSKITHMAQMMAKQAWLVSVVWRTMGDDGKYVTIKKKDVEFYEERLKNAKTDKEKKDFRIFDNIEWNTIGAPVVPILDEDGEDTGEVKPIKVRDIVGDLQMFMWDNAQAKFWDSLFIEGTYTVKVDGKEVEKSKNFLQNMILEAKNFEGSSLEALLAGLDDLGTGAPKEQEEEQTKKSVETADEKKTSPKSTEGSTDQDDADTATTSPSDEPEEEEADEFEELGL